MNKEQVKAELSRRVMILNDVSQQLLLARREACGYGDPDRRRDLNKECGYPEFLTKYHFLKMLDRNGIANRVNSIYPDECWAVDPLVYENEKKRDTPFEAAWKKLLKKDACNPLHYAHRADLESGKGHFGLLLIGTDDGSPDFSRPLPGIDEQGNPDPRTRRPLQLLYLRALSERSVQIAKFQDNKNNARFGHPLMYNVAFSNNQISGLGDSPAPIEVDADIREVHWSRVIHLADNRAESEVYGVPRLRPVYNRLADADKILASSGEMLYKGGFPGISVEIDPRVLEAMNLDIDEESVEHEMRAYMNGLQRYLLLIGMKANPLTAQVADPTPHLTAQLNSIAMAIGAPLRIFMGSEQAQLASGQDVRTWNRRLRKRQVRYLTPMVLRPMIDRFIAVGILPPPKDDYNVVWPDVNMPDEKEMSEIADRRSASLLKFISGGGYQMMQPSDFYRFVWKLPLDQVEEIMANMTAKAPELQITPPTAKAGDSGSGAGSPSDPPDGGQR